MKLKTHGSIFLIFIFLFAASSHAEEAVNAACGEESCIDETVAEPSQEVVRIGYEEFVKRRKSDEKFILLDVRPKPDFILRHIPGAVSFPVSEMAYERVHERLLNKKIPIIVYCFSTKCPMSVNAAKRLISLGYSVVDYKGGIWEWLERGNIVISGEGELVQTQYYDEYKDD